MDQTDQAVPASSPHNPKTLLVAVLVLGVLGLVLGGVFLSGFFNTDTEEGEQEEEGQEEVAEQALAPNILIYGNWHNNKTAIKAYNLSTGNTTVLARIGDDIKKVTVLSSEELLFINKTDNKDHGKELMLYSMSNKRGEAVYKADQGFGIDDYVVSPDGKYIAVWEVRFPQNSGILRSGTSRVYSAEIGKSGKNRLYDEVQIGGTPVHYPRAITDNGDVFSDTFLPNSGAGWAYGMSVSNFWGTQKQDLTNMQNGTYGTQPTLSPDGKYLAFAGYDGSLGSGTELVNGARRALIRSNTIELLDTQTKLRQKLTVPNTSTYDSVRWDKISGRLVFVAFSKIAANEGTFSYDLVTKQPTKLALGDREVGARANTLASYLSNGNLLVGTLEISESALGNLGEAYGAPYTTLGVIAKTADSTGDSTVEPVRVRDGMVQMIAVVPVGYFPTKSNSKRAKTGIAATGNKKNGDKNNDDDGCGGKNNIQLCLFSLKPELAPKRLRQQSDNDDEGKDGNGGRNGGRDGGRDGGGDGGRNGGRDGGRPDLPSTGGTQPQDSVNKQAGRQPRDCGAHISQKCDNATDKDSCTTEVKSPGNNPCADSPLYIYGQAGKKVSVSVNTRIYNSNAAYNNRYNIVLLSDNRLEVAGQVLDSIEYDYEVGIKHFDRPTYGTIVSQMELASTLITYGLKLGLNAKETADLIAYAKEKLTAPYVFVSFFDQTTSEQLLPLSFTPQPDNYLNVVFYFKQYSQKPSFKPILPLFKPFVTRTGLTAVEISAMVE